jgi:predicted PurR-regulated permease PerM
MNKRKLVEIVGTLSQKKVTVTVLEDIAAQIEQFLVIQLATSGIVAVVTGLALWAMGLQQAALWGLLAGIFNSIPYYGPLLVTGGLALVGFLQFGTIGMTVAVAGMSLLITTRRLTPDADADGPRGVHESSGRVRRFAVLELGLGRLGHAACGTDDDGH